jgi:hypothetical protein
MDEIRSERKGIEEGRGGERGKREEKRNGREVTNEKCACERIKAERR